jgi:FdhE protein
MSDAADCADRWRERIARAKLLADETPSASSILAFYGRLAERQAALAARVPRRPAATFADAIDAEHAAAAIPGFLDWLRGAAPPPLAVAASALVQSVADWRPLVRARLTAAADEENSSSDIEPDGAVPQETAARFAIDAVIQPYAEVAAVSLDAGGSLDRPVGGLTAGCPACGSAPSVGVLREDGHGARRTLVCARCLTEWPYRRVVCTSCGEEEFEKLPVYTADALPHVRVDACDRCRRYLKTVDLSKNGLAVPVVDDLATVSLDLWAKESGYHRLRANLLQL